MKIRQVSDLHLEFSDIHIKNDDNCDVLILGGDICVVDDLKSTPVATTWNDAEESVSNRVTRGMRYRDFFLRVSFQFPHVFYVLGNHEHYNGKIDQSREILESTFGYLGISNIYILENDTKIIQDRNHDTGEVTDVTFVGGTLWTDMNKGDPLTMYHLEHSMSDFSRIRIAKEHFRKFLPQRAMIEHQKTKQYIAHVIDNLPKDARVVVVTHHTPSFQSTHEKYATETLMNGGYHSELSEFILDRPKIKLWTHGHTHDCFDYMIGDCRVVCNPRGYETSNFSEHSGWNPNITLEI
jgi:Icc-related predicted phosphoesterase